MPSGWVLGPMLSDININNLDENVVCMIKMTLKLQYSEEDYLRL